MTIETDLVQRFDQIKSDRHTVESQWDDLERYVTPYRGKFQRDTTGETSIEWTRFGNDFDSTAVHAHQLLAAKIHGAVTSPSVRWFDMKFREDKLNEDRVSAEWLSQCSDLTYNALRDSNLDLEINETYQDLAGFGTACITMEEFPGPTGQWNGLLFSAVPLKEVFFEEDFLGRVQRFYRELMWTPAQIISKFGNNVPDRIKKLEEAGRTEKQRVIFCIYPRNNRIIPIGEKVSPSRRPWEYCYLLHDDKAMLGKPGGYYEMPAYIPRWRKTSESAWGNSPGMLAMGDIKTLNQLVKQDLVRGEKEVDPPLLAEERALFADLDIRAGGISVVRSIEGIKELYPSNSTRDTFARMERLQNAIDRHFYVPGLQNLLLDSKERTAYEVARMQEEVLQMLGPTLGRIQNDLLNPIIGRAFRMLARERQLPDPPAKVMEMAATFDVEYLGPMARAQRMEEAGVIERFVSFGAQLAQLVADGGSDQNPMDNIDVDKAVRRMGRRMSVPAEVIRDEKDVKSDRTSRQELRREMEAAALAEQQGRAQEAAGRGQEAMNG
jgi:hypothetical protein